MINKPNDTNQGLFELHSASGWSRKFSQDAPAERSSRGLPFNDCQVAYQPSLRPIDGKCPRKECNVEIDSYVKVKFDPIKVLLTYLFVRVDADNKWDHVFKCVKAQQQGEHKFVEFCFICNQAVGGFERWEIHCQEHIRKCEIPTRCDFVKFRRAIAYAGNCITCLHNEQLPAARRLYGFMKQSSWKKHIHKCFFSDINKSGSQTELHCPDPLCSTEYDSTEDLWYHLQDVHSYPSPQAGSRLKTEKDTFMRGYAAPNSHQPKRRQSVENIPL